MRGKTRPKIVWNKTQQNVPLTSTAPRIRELGWLPKPDSFFKELNPNKVEAYKQAMLEGTLFSLRQDDYSSLLVITDAWLNTEAADGQLPYLSHRRFNPSASSRFHTLPKGTMAIYVGTRRVTEWDGKGWARYIRPAFLINGIVVLVLSAYDIDPT
jgi:hypothetical protein